MKKQCNTCKSNLLESFYIEQSGDDCVFCASKRIKVEERKPKQDYEVVEDVGCAGGACAL